MAKSNYELTAHDVNGKQLYTCSESVNAEVKHARNFNISNIGAGPFVAYIQVQDGERVRTFAV